MIARAQLQLIPDLYVLIIPYFPTFMAHFFQVRPEKNATKTNLFSKDKITTTSRWKVLV